MNKLKYLSIVLYPYLFTVIICAIVIVGKTLLPYDPADLPIEPFIITILLVSAIVIIFSVVAFFSAVKLSILTYLSKHQLYSSAKALLIIKLAHIPAYVFNFLIGCIGVLMSVWGIGLIFLAIFLDLICISLSGIASIGLSLKLRKINTSNFYIFTGISSFIYCIDVIVATYYYFKVKKVKDEI